MKPGEMDGQPGLERDADLNDVPEVSGWRIDMEGDGEWEFPLAERNDGSEYFSLTNRPFAAIDEFVTYKFIALILKKINENPGRKIIVMDIGGGVLSRAAIDILRHPLMCGKVRVINVDPFARQLTSEEIAQCGISPEDLIIIPGEFARCQIPEGSIDAVISYQVLNFMTDRHFLETNFKLASILAPGGEAYLDNDGAIERDRNIYSGVPVTYPRTYESSRTFMRDYRWLMAQGVRIDETSKEVSAIDDTVLTEKPTKMIHMGKRSISRFSHGLQIHRYPAMNEFSAAWPQLGEVAKGIN